MGRLIDFLATRPWYLEHLAPIWRELGPAARHFYVSPSAERAAGDLAGVTRDAVSAEDVPLVTVAYADHATGRTAGRRRLALGQHGAGQSYLGAGGPRNSSYPGGDHQDDVGLFLVPNTTAARVTLAAYPAARVAIVGCPKVDDLPRLRPDAPAGVVAISTHWNGRLAPEAGSAWDTFRRPLLELARSHPVIGHAHPRMLARVAPFYRAARIEVVESFREVLERASVFVCDNSSSLFEFAATARPVVVLNAPSYRRDVDHGLRFWEAAGVGVNVDTTRALAAAVDRALELRPTDVAAREAALELVYQPRQGSARKAAAVLTAWADTPPTPPNCGDLTTRHPLR